MNRGRRGEPVFWRNRIPPFTEILLHKSFILSPFARDRREGISIYKKSIMFKYGKNTSVFWTPKYSTFDYVRETLIM
jgi:hypothetical protein